MAHRSRLPEDADPVPAYALEAAPATSFLPQAAPPAYAEASSAGKQHEQNGLTAGWRVPPFYLTSIDRADHKEATTALYMRLPTDAQADQRASTSSSSSLEACKCSERGDCTCNRRGVVAFTAELGLRDNDFAPKGEIVIVRGTNKADIVARLKRGTLRHRSRWTVLDPQGKHWAYVERHGVETTVRPPEDNVSLRWVRESGTFTLTASPDSVLLGKHLPDGVLCLENTSERMPQSLACDFDNCPFDSYIFGFAFRCLDCTEELKGQDTVDFCEAHLEHVCTQHDSTHRFVRLPPRQGTAGEADGTVRETQLLHLPILLQERKRHELVVLSLAVALLDP